LLILRVLFKFKAGFIKSQTKSPLELKAVGLCLSSGGRDRLILNRDVRAPSDFYAELRCGNTCGLGLV
jgi:hypothetical protein